MRRNQAEPGHQKEPCQSRATHRPEAVDRVETGGAAAGIRSVLLEPCRQEGKRAAHQNRGAEEERGVKRGDCIVIPPGAEHKLTNTGDEPLVLLCCCAPAYSDEDTVLTGPA